MIKYVFGILLAICSFTAIAQEAEMYVPVKEGIDYKVYTTAPFSGVFPTEQNPITILIFANYEDQNSAAIADFLSQYDRGISSPVKIRFEPYWFENYQRSSVKLMLVINQMGSNEDHYKIFKAIQNKIFDPDNLMQIANFISTKTSIPLSDFLIAYKDANGNVGNQMTMLPIAKKYFNLKSIPLIIVNNMMYCDIDMAGGSIKRLKEVLLGMLSKQYKNVRSQNITEQQNNN